MQLLRSVWGAARSLNREAPDEDKMMRRRSAEELEALWSPYGFEDVTTEPFAVEVASARAWAVRGR